MLDAWAAVRFFEDDEPAASAVQNLLTTPGLVPVMSTVNYAETIWALACDLGIDAAHPTVEDLREALDLQAPSVTVAVAAARLKRGWHLSLGDAFAAATAVAHSAPVWTGDPELLSSDRMWLAHDLRSPQLKAQHTANIDNDLRKIGRRTDPDNDLAALSDHQLAAHVLQAFTPTMATPPSPPLVL
ncbi:MAG: PIN domain-containing protein [Acidimicrobiaceae bacterium]|nr:PIN domain-containing protein [Acidimicrobiaceae bacterium]